MCPSEKQLCSTHLVRLSTFHRHFWLIANLVSLTLTALMQFGDNEPQHDFTRRPKAIRGADSHNQCSISEDVQPHKPALNSEILFFQSDQLWCLWCSSALVETWTWSEVSPCSSSRLHWCLSLSAFDSFIPAVWLCCKHESKGRLSRNQRRSSQVCVCVFLLFNFWLL